MFCKENDKKQNYLKENFFKYKTIKKNDNHTGAFKPLRANRNHQALIEPYKFSILLIYTK